MAHHYTEYIDVSDIAHAEEVVASICNDYDILNTHHVLPSNQQAGIASAIQTPAKLKQSDDDVFQLSKIRFPAF